MKYSIVAILLFGILPIQISNTSSLYVGNTTASVTIAGGIIKAKNINESEKKHKREKCPICKGKGWYISGDGIKKIDCSYCEP